MRGWSLSPTSFFTPSDRGLSTMAAAEGLERRPMGATMRRDLWWVQPLLVFLGFSTFIVYSTWRAFEAEHFVAGPYLSPFFSPLIFDHHAEVSSHAWFGSFPEWWPK